MASLEPLEGKVVRIHRGGPKSRTGVLLGVKKDYLIMWNEEDGIQYLARNHIQSICEDKKGNFNFVLEDTVVPTFINADTFVDCLRKLEYQWVRVNDGPECVEGIVVDVKDEYIKMISDQEVRIMYVFHLKSVSPGPRPGEKPNNNKQSGEKNEEKQEEKQPEEKQKEKQQGKKQRDGNKESGHKGHEENRQNPGDAKDKEGPEVGEKSVPAKEK
ncbi:MAG: hypothetical protein ACOX4L_02050 [Bacillota bacterium]|jgi:spore coat protein B